MPIQGVCHQEKPGIFNEFLSSGTFRERTRNFRFGCLESGKLVPVCGYGEASGMLEFLSEHIYHPQAVVSCAGFV